MLNIHISRYEADLKIVASVFRKSGYLVFHAMLDTNINSSVVVLEYDHKSLTIFNVSVGIRNVYNVFFSR